MKVTDCVDGLSLWKGRMFWMVVSWVWDGIGGVCWVVGWGDARLSQILGRFRAPEFVLFFGRIEF